jgi:hypothetical protein
MQLSKIQFGIAENLLVFIYSMAIIICISYFLYYKRGGKKEFLFTYIAIGAVVFQLCVLLKTLTLDLGFAFGLFAVFSLIRLRTNQVQVREMAYLFVTAGIAVLDGLVTDEAFHVILLWDMLLVLFVLIAELLITKIKIQSKLVIYEKLDLIQEDRYDELIDDLEKRLSIKKISRVKIGEVNLLRNTAELMVYFKDYENRNY